MSNVKRYEMEKEYSLDIVVVPVEESDGTFVHYEDYAELKAQRDALAAEVSAIREQSEDVYAAGYNHGHLNTVDGIAYAPPVEDEFYHNALQVMLEVETPATDAYHNSVRAEGVEMFARFWGINCGHEKTFIGSEARAFAAQLRSGEPS